LPNNGGKSSLDTKIFWPENGNSRSREMAEAPEDEEPGFKVNLLGPQGDT